jgi:CubicO group peptidase (beta-lactamase class C family)
MYVGAPQDMLARAAKLMWPTRGGFFPRLPLSFDSRPSELVTRSAALVQGLLHRGGIEFDLRSILDGLAPRGLGTFDFNAEPTLRAAIPAANGLFTARSLARMYAALAGGGELDGVRLLSRRTLARATQVQTKPRGGLVIPFDMSWRLGYHAVFTTRGSPRHAFGHFGFGGSGAWADPRRNLAVGLIVNSGMGTPFGDMRIARVGGVALTCANRRSAAAPSWVSMRGAWANVLDALALY